MSNLAEAEPIVQARMLNKFVFCPRRGYLEFVHGEWADNSWTAEGTWVHRRVDARDQAMPADDGELPFEARSVELTAPSLGLTGKLDLVQGQFGEAIPVEYKKGKPPKSGTEPYPSDQAQLCAQALMLIENGWTVDRGYLYYAQTKEKRELIFTPELLDWARQTLIEFREVTARPVAPPPLKGSHKCQYCSLVEICLPDEVNHLLEQKPEQSAPVRQLLAPVDETLPVYITKNGAAIGIKGECLEVRLEGAVIANYRFIDISQVCLFGNVQLSTQALRELAGRNIPICYFSYGGWFSAVAHGHSHKNVDLRRQQFQKALDPAGCLELAKGWVASKILNCRTLLRRNGKPSVASLAELKRLATTLDRCDSLETLLGVEGYASRLYFQSFTGMLKFHPDLAAQFDQEGRQRRPPPDPINAVLSYLYSLLTRELTVIAQSIGLDPYQGFYHQTKYGKPALALDLMEEFRPLIADSVLVSLFNNQVLSSSDFRRMGAGVALTQAARRKVIEAYERRLQQEAKHPWFDYRLSYRRILYVQTRLLARHLLGEIPALPMFTTR
jgi:CRISP-associated protein Cas1